MPSSLHNLAFLLSIPLLLYNFNPGKIYRLEVTPTGFGPPFLMGPTGGMRGGHLQLGPDGNIYYAIPEAWGNAGKGKIGRITNPNGGGTLDNN